jgi:hypothetical protein
MTARQDARLTGAPASEVAGYAQDNRRPMSIDA